MRMTRDAYAREVWKAVEAVRHGEDGASCPRENCDERVKVLAASVKVGKIIICPAHGIIYRE
jgi:hypothetical protein